MLHSSLRVIYARQLYDNYGADRDGKCTQATKAYLNLSKEMEADEELLPKFSSLRGKVNRNTLKAIKRLGFKRMTATQAAALPKILAGSDVVCTARTGSGKTLAFLIPAIEAVKEQGTFSGTDGITCIVISPTRELAMQTHHVLKDLTMLDDTISSALVIGGESRAKQASELSRGVDIVVATPGRLLDHMRDAQFPCSRLACLVLDEADKMLQYGFEEDLRTIVGMLPKKRQTLLFSATRDDKTDKLVKIATNASLESVNVDEDKTTATVDGLKHGYVVCDLATRLWWLFAALKRMRKQKSMVFFSSCASVQFHQAFFREHCGAPVSCIHGKMAQGERTSAIEQFRTASRGALLCTDVAARGLDIPAVDWVVQYDPPADATEYVHRAGRTARGAGATGSAVMLLRPDETSLLDHLRRAKIYLEPYRLWDTFDDLQPMLELAVREDGALARLAAAACAGYARSLATRRLKDAFDARSLDARALAAAFGLAEPPHLDIDVGFKKKHRPRKRMAALSAAAGIGDCSAIKSAKS